MLKIAVAIFAFALSLFFAFLFWDLSDDFDSRILSALFGSLTFVSIFCAIMSCLGALFAIGSLFSIGG